MNTPWRDPLLRLAKNTSQSQESSKYKSFPCKVRMEPQANGSLTRPWEENKRDWRPARDRAELGSPSSSPAPPHSISELEIPGSDLSSPACRLWKGSMKKVPVCFHQGPALSLTLYEMEEMRSREPRDRPSPKPSVEKSEHWSINPSMTLCTSENSWITPYFLTPWALGIWQTEPMASCPWALGSSSPQLSWLLHLSAGCWKAFWLPMGENFFY